MKKTGIMIELLSVLAFAVAGSGVAAADTIDFAQFGPDGTALGSPLTGTTANGVGVTLISPNASFAVLEESNEWHGIFPLGALILYDGFGSGAVALDFATGISSLTLAAQANDTGAYTETALAYSGATPVDTVSASSFNYQNTGYPLYTGTVPFLTVTGTDITSVVFETTNDADGFALDGATPEPGTLSLLGLGLAAVGFARLRKRIRLS
jgi:hypothetical protein